MNLADYLPDELPAKGEAPDVVTYLVTYKDRLGKVLGREVVGHGELPTANGINVPDSDGWRFVPSRSG